MTETEEFVAHLTDENGEELRAGVSVTAFRPEGNEIVDEVRELLVDEYEVIER